MYKTLITGVVLSVCTALMPAAAWAADPAKQVDSAAGKYWADAKGMPLYTFAGDTTAGKSACNGDCATEWPPLPAAAADTASGDWTIVTRDDGTKMWALAGHPLYTFIRDKPNEPPTGEGEDDFHVAK